MNKHLIFFDETCPLCQNTMRYIQERDTQQIFAYYPLQSEMAKKRLPAEWLKGDTVVLIEKTERVFVRARAIFRILALLKHRFSWFYLGLSYLPGIDLFYRIIAHNRRWLS